MTHYCCLNCGFWQRRFAEPATCPVCEDFRHPLPPAGYAFATPDAIAGSHNSTWEEVLPDVWRFATTPSIGIGPCGWLVRTPTGNVHFEGAGWYPDDALDFLARLGGVRFLSASHPHVYGALWRVVERFASEVVLHTGDLNFAQAFRVSYPFDDAWPLTPDVDLHHTGGHTPGHAVLHWKPRRLLMAGDALKFTFPEPGQTVGLPDAVSCHAAFDAHVPLSHAQVRRYRQVLEPLDFDAVLTPWEAVTAGGKTAAMRLFEAQLSGKPFADRMRITR